MQERAPTSAPLSLRPLFAIPPEPIDGKISIYRQENQLFGDLMGKLEIKFKLSGLEFEIKGESEDVVAKAAAMQRQVQGMFGTIGSLTNGTENRDQQNPQNGAATKLIEAAAEAQQNSNRGKRTARRSGGERGSAEALTFRHDASKYGNPIQSWGNTEKCNWLLYVLKDMDVAKEVSGPQLAATFNHHFKATGTVRPSHATRELGRAKLKNPALVGEDKSQEPSLWYLTDEGNKSAQQLIQSILNPA